jgi:hypothetical protein
MRVAPTIEECKVELRRAQQLLKSVKKRAQDLRIEFLLQSLDEATAESEASREKALRNILRSQEKLQSFFVYGTSSNQSGFSYASIQVGRQPVFRHLHWQM